MENKLIIHINLIHTDKEDNKRGRATGHREDNHHAVGTEDHPAHHPAHARARHQVACQPAQQETGSGI